MNPSELLGRAEGVNKERRERERRIVGEAPDALDGVRLRE
jgi:hypothetical protein